MDAPSAAEIRAYLKAGHTQIDAAQRFRINRSKVQRILKAAELDDGPGPTETVARLLVREWGELDPSQAAKAENLIGLAVIADIGRRSNANGAERNAAVAALKEFRSLVESLGTASGYEELRKALLDER